MIYLAGPYTHKNPEVREIYYKLLSQVALELMMEGEFVISPITHGHAMEVEGQNMVPYQQWIAHGLYLLQASRHMAVVQLPGWENSNGVNVEMCFANANGIPWNYIDEYDYLGMKAVDNKLIARLKELLKEDNE